MNLRGSRLSDGLLVLSTPIERPRRFPQLTPAEQRAVDGVLDGLEVRQIAAAARVSTGTVAKQLQSAYRKLGVGSRGELASAAMKLRESDEQLEAGPRPQLARGAPKQRRHRRR